MVSLIMCIMCIVMEDIVINYCWLNNEARRLVPSCEQDEN